MKYWYAVDEKNDAFDCDSCLAMVQRPTPFCPRCGDRKTIVSLVDKVMPIEFYWKEYDYEYFCMLGLDK